VWARATAASSSSSDGHQQRAPIENHRLYWLSQPGACFFLLFLSRIYTNWTVFFSLFLLLASSFDTHILALYHLPLPLSFPPFLSPHYIFIRFPPSSSPPLSIVFPPVIPRGNLLYYPHYDAIHPLCLSAARSLHRSLPMRSPAVPSVHIRSFLERESKRRETRLGDIRFSRGGSGSARPSRRGSGRARFCFGAAARGQHGHRAAALGP
jgi:hypothetical protein